jgi:hypothetical protein
MIAMAAMRRVGACLVALFLLAQIFGVIPLLSAQVTHLAESDLALCHGNVAIETIPQNRHHHRGDADGFILHHELQDLTGAFVCLSGQCGTACVRRAITAYVTGALAEAEPTPLDRPPKSLPSV